MIPPTKEEVDKQLDEFKKIADKTAKILQEYYDANRKMYFA
jgi:hypothetical protein